MIQHNIFDRYTAVAITKLDILDELDEVKIGVKYVKDGAPVPHFPSSVQVRIVDSPEN